MLITEHQVQMELTPSTLCTTSETQIPSKNFLKRKKGFQTTPKNKRFQRII